MRESEVEGRGSVVWVVVDERGAGLSCGAAGAGAGVAMVELVLVREWFECKGQTTTTTTVALRRQASVPKLTHQNPQF